MTQADCAVEWNGDDIVVDAHLLAPLLEIAPADVPALMRDGQIVGVCERGEGEHAGLMRMTFTYQSRSAALTVNGDGDVIRRSTFRKPERTAPSLLELGAKL